MRVPQPYKCDYCEKLKGESNHWWLFWTKSEAGFFRFSTWDDVSAEKEGVEHICGQACAGKALAKWMESQQ